MKVILDVPFADKNRAQKALQALREETGDESNLRIVIDGEDNAYIYMDDYSEADAEQFLMNEGFLRGWQSHAECS